MKHLIISREYPPASYTPGGIGTYVMNIARLLAERGQIVHVIGERWSGAPDKLEITCNGRLFIHRIGESDLPPGDSGGGAGYRGPHVGMDLPRSAHQGAVHVGADLADR